MQEKDAKDLAKRAGEKWKSLCEGGDGEKGDEKDEIGSSLADEMVEQLRIAREAEEKQREENGIKPAQVVVDESERARLVAMYGVVEDSTTPSSTAVSAAPSAAAGTQQGKKGKREKVDVNTFSSDMNKGAAQAMADRQRAEMKAAHEAKVEQDKKSREKQKMSREEKKAQRRAACQKVERRR